MQEVGERIGVVGEETKKKRAGLTLVQDEFEPASLSPTLARSLRVTWNPLESDF